MLVVLNHKMNLTFNQALLYQSVLADGEYKDTVVVCPNMAYLSLFQNNNYYLGSQNVSPFMEGNHTGEVSSKQLKSLGVSYCLVGHSERRYDFHDEEGMLVDKLKALLEVNISPILCIGESKEEKKQGLLEDVLKKEIDNCFSKLEIEKCANIIIAYEPIWAIGTGEVPVVDEIIKAIEFIKKYIKMNYSLDVKVLYGGSINEKNYNTLKEISSIDGLLIGGFGLKIESLKNLICS